MSAFSLLLTSSPAQAAPPDPTTTCEVAKLKAAGKKADCLAKEEAKAILGKPSSPVKCENVFIRAFATAEAAAAIAHGTCPVTGDVDEIEGLVDTCVEDIAIAIKTGVPPICPSAQFLATGQTTAYQADKNDGIAGPVAVPDDGTVEAGATLNYTDNSDGTVTDNNTGMMWEKKTNEDGTENYADIHDVDNTYVWSGNGSQETIWDWLDDINAEGGTGYAGHSDWRIPNVKELQSIVDYSQFTPAIDPIFGPTVPTYHSALTWSSTSYASPPSNAWIVYLDNGDVNSIDKGNLGFVRAVRGGQP